MMNVNKQYKKKGLCYHNVYCNLKKMTEIWKTIPNFSNYEASDLGNIRNCKTKYILKQHKQGGYLCLGLTNDNKEIKTVSVHRLVAFAHLPNPQNKKTVNHIDINKINNTLINLEWATALEQNNPTNRNIRKESFGHSRSVILTDKDNGELVKRFDTINAACEYIFF
jgi:hypothetical protein